MHIAEICPLWFPTPPADHGGTERFVHDLGEALVAEGHELTLFAAEGSRTSGTLVPMGPPISTVQNAPPSLPNAAECVMLDRVADRADEFDIIHCHTEFYHAAALRPWRHKLVTTIHWRADETDRQTYFRHFDDLSVIAISRAQAEQLPNGNVAGIVHHGIDAQRYRLQEHGAGHVAFIGRMTDQKGPDRAIRIARAAGMPIRLAGTIDVGNPTYHKREVEPLLGDDAVWLGGIGDADKQTLLGGAEALIFPIEWPEPFGLVIIEAYACGTPVIAYRNGAVAELIDDGVTGFVVDDERQAAEAIAMARKLDRRRIREVFEARFTAARMARDYAAIFEKLASNV